MSNKYDCTLNLSSHNSLSIILHQIVPGSKILEIGPSTGRMTRYLKETLNCDVWIIECDREAFEIARQYASCGICADVEQLDWDLTFEKIRFDYVICVTGTFKWSFSLHRNRCVRPDTSALLYLRHSKRTYF